MTLTTYQIQPHTRRCTATGRELQPGERFFSVLVEQDGKFVRQDYAAAAWTGPPPGAIGFWGGRVPAPEQKSRPRFDDDMLLECFHRLDGAAEAGRVNFRYILALLLMRRKRLRFEQTRKDGALEYLQLRCVATGTLYDVLDPRLSDEAMTAVQDEVFQVLGWD